MTASAAPNAASFCQTLRTRFGNDITEGSAIDQEEAFAEVLTALRPRRILEIGTRYGVSAAYFAQFADSVVTIDIEKSPESYRRKAREIWKSTGLEGKIESYLAPGDVGWQYNAAKRGFIGTQEFDFAFIDGSHHWRDVLFDFDCVHRCGCVLFHDYKPEGGAYADCDNERFQGIADVIDSLHPAAYIIGKHCSQMAVWLSTDHPARQSAAAYLQGLPRPSRGRLDAKLALTRRHVERRLERLSHSFRKRFGG
jgi:predicted O-methyltransferase YrrM